MQISAAGVYGQRLVCRVAAHISAKVYRVAAYAQKLKISPVRIVNEQRQRKLPAHVTNAFDIKDIAHIVRACDIDAQGRSFGVFECVSNILRSDERLAERGRGGGRGYKAHIKVYQAGGIDKRLMRVA